MPQCIVSVCVRCFIAFDYHTVPFSPSVLRFFQAALYSTYLCAWIFRIFIVSSFRALTSILEYKIWPHMDHSDTYRNTHVLSEVKRRNILLGARRETVEHYQYTKLAYRMRHVTENILIITQVLITDCGFLWKLREICKCKNVQNAISRRQ